MRKLLQALLHHSCHHVKTMFSLQVYPSFQSSALPGVIKRSELRCVCCHTYTHIKSLWLLKYVTALIVCIKCPRWELSSFEKCWKKGIWSSAPDILGYQALGWLFLYGTTAPPRWVLHTLFTKVLHTLHLIYRTTLYHFRNNQRPTEVMFLHRDDVVKFVPSTIE